jgi:hypothetical protein
MIFSYIKKAALSVSKVLLLLKKEINRVIFGLEINSV